MKKLYFLSFLILNTFFSLSQNWTWDSITTGYAGTRLCKDNYHHIYAFNRNDTVLLKYNTTGGMIWQKNFPSNCKIQSITCSTDSSVYIIGNFTGTLTIAQNNYISRGLEDVFICKLSPSGNILWVTTIGSRDEDSGNDICMNGLNIVVTGHASDTIYFGNQMFAKQNTEELFVAKYFSNGTFNSVLLAIQTTPPQNNDGSFGQDVETDQAGNIILIANMYTDLMIGTTTFSGTYNSYYVLKFNQNLQLQWSTLICSGVHDYACELKCTNSNDLFLVKQNNGNHSSSSQIIKIASTGGNFTSCYTTAHVYGYGDVGQISGLDLDSCNNVYFTGTEKIGLHPKYSFLTGQLSPAGNLNWIRKDSAVNSRLGIDIVAFTLNRCYVSGNFCDTIHLKNLHVGPPVGQGVAYLHAILQATFGIPTNVTPSTNMLICNNKSTTLTCSTGGAITWYANLQSLTPLHTGSTYTTPLLAPGTYTYYAEANTCTMTTGRLPVVVSVLPGPTITVNNGTICAGQYFQINPSGAITYSYPANNPLVSPPASMIYTIGGIDANGCASSATCLVTVKPAPSLVVTTSNNQLCSGQSATLIASGANTYTWNTSLQQTQIVVSPSISTTYLLAGSDAQGCSSSVLYTQYVNACTSLQDNLSNNKFMIYPNPSKGQLWLEIETEGKLAIYNAIGNKIYESNFAEGKHELNLSKFAHGIYIAELRNQNGKMLRKVIVE